MGCLLAQAEAGPEPGEGEVHTGAPLGSCKSCGTGKSFAVNHFPEHKHVGAFLNVCCFPGTQGSAEVAWHTVPSTQRGSN